MNQFNIQLDTLMPTVSNTEHSARLLRNAMLTRLDAFVKAQNQAPSWVAHVQRESFRGVVMNPHLVYVLTRKPLLFSWDELDCAMKKSTPQPLKPSIVHTIEPELLRYYNDQCALKDRAQAWVRTDIDVENAVSQALLLLKAYWEPGYDLVCTLVKEIILIESPEFLSGSLPRLHGAMLLSPKSDWRVAHFVEALVHEASHLELNIRRMIEPFLQNPTAYGYSAIRHEERPLLGILHAAFVLCRTTSALAQIAATPEHNQDCVVLLAKFVPVLLDTLEVLHTRAQFTTVGAQLYAQMCEHAQRMGPCLH